ncbi:MAG: FAD-dependent monooxygenase, partial [Deltaproteobacteria bacterium]
MQIAILGAGVAGVSAAIALTGRGHSVQIYERRQASATLGAGVTLWPNATFVLAELRILDRLHQVSGRPRSMQRFDAASATLGVIDIRAIDEHMGHPTLSVLRRDLQRVLLDRLGELGVVVSYGRSATEVGERGVQAWTRFEDGEEITADAVLGAEGRMSSAARRYVNPSAMPVYQGFVNWVGIAESSDLLVEDPDAIIDFWGTGSRFGIVPLGSRRVYWAGGKAMPLDAIGAPEDLRAELQAQFAEWPAVVRRIIDASARPSLRTIAVHDLEPMSCWHRGRVVLIGDAAHASLPTSGQGACQALEDAWHLARCLRHDSLDPEGAFEMFTRVREMKTRHIALAGRHLAWVRILCRERNPIGFAELGEGRIRIDRERVAF